MMADEIDLAEYLFTRLRQVGVKAIFGVPGDYNLTALDYVEPAGLDWVGNANELGAGYAADGYGRIKGISAMVTVLGVGELSAINAMAGSYAERAPVVYIVGTPPTAAQNNKVILHHTLGDGNYNVFAEMAAKVTVAQTNLIDDSVAAEEVDRAIRECIIHSRPVYVQLPTDKVSAKVSRARLRTPIDTSIHYGEEGTEADDILERIYSSKQPFIIVDGFTRAYGLVDEADELVRVTGFPTSTTPFGKGTINETYPNFHGVYAGVAGKQDYMPWVENCDLVLRIGPLNSDVNTFGFTTVPPASKTITFHRDTVEIGNTSSSWQPLPTYTNIHVKSLLRSLLSKLDPSRLPKYSPYPTHLGDPRQLLAELSPTGPKDTIDQDTFYQRISTIFNPHDIILTETGTLSVGSRDMILPPHSILINSSIWLSIGYMLPAALGARLAQSEFQSETKSSHRAPRSPYPTTPTPSTARTILFEGDGSLQMTVQTISDILRVRANMTIFVLNNDGYTIERWIHGMKATYNDVPMWEYRDLPRVFGANKYGPKGENAKLSPNLRRNQATNGNGHANGTNANGTKDDDSYPIFTAAAHTWGELWSVVADPQFNTPTGLKIVEIFMGWEDAPETLKVLVQGAAKRNQGRKGQVGNKAGAKSGEEGGKKGMGEINGKPEPTGGVVGGTTGNEEHDEVVQKVVSAAG